MKRTGALIAVSTAIMVLAALGLWAVVRTHSALPRPAEAIQADWAALSGERPRFTRPNPASSSAFQLDQEPSLVEPEQIEPLYDAVHDNVVPIGCSLLLDLKDTPLDPSPSQVFHAGRALIHHQEPEAAAVLGRDLLDGDFLAFTTGTALLRAVRDDGIAGPPPTLDQLRRSLLRETQCGLDVITTLGDGSLPEGSRPAGLDGPLVDLDTTRLRYLHRMLDLIGRIQTDVPSTRAALQQPLPPTGPLADVLAVSPAAVEKLLVDLH